MEKVIMRYTDTADKFFKVEKTERGIVKLLLKETEELYTGEIEIRYENDKIYSKGEIRLGMKEGEWRSYYRTGELKVVEHYEKGLKEGEYKEYYENGQLEKEMIFKDDEQIGIYKSYYKSGKIAMISELLEIEGEKVENIIETSEDENNKMVYTKINDKIEGEVKVWREGKVHIYNYVAGKKNGKSVDMITDNFRLEGYYEDDKKTGNWIGYKGEEIILKDEYKDDKLLNEKVYIGGEILEEKSYEYTEEYTKEEIKKYLENRLEELEYIKRKYRYKEYEIDETECYENGSPLYKEYIKKEKDDRDERLYVYKKGDWEIYKERVYVNNKLHIEREYKEGKIIKENKYRKRFKI